MVAAHGAGAGFQDIAERPPLRAWSDPGTDAESAIPATIRGERWRLRVIRQRGIKVNRSAVISRVTE